MARSDFALKILRQHWIKDDGLYDPHDLCSHGEVLIRIGDEVLSDEASGSWTLSVAALFLMRTLDSDVGFQGNDNYLVPCDGFSFWYVPDKGLVIPGGNDGVDWKVTHHGSEVELETASGTRVHLYIRDYRTAIIGFAREVESFYGDPDRKILYDPDMDGKGFDLFWKEWRSRMQAWGGL